MTATREHLSGLELARETLNHWPVTGLVAAKLALDQLIAEAQSAEPVQGEAVFFVDPEALAFGDRSTRSYRRKNDVATLPLYTSPDKPDAELVELLQTISGIFPADMSDDKSSRTGWLPHIREAVNKLRAKLAELQQCSPAE